MPIAHLPLCRKSRLIKETPIHNFVAMGFSCEFLHWTCSEPHNGKWCNLKCSNESIRCSDRLLYSQITPTSRLPSTCYHTRPTNHQNNSVFKAKRQTFIPKTVSDETRIFIHYSCVVHIVAVLFTLYLCYSHYICDFHIVAVLCCSHCSHVCSCVLGRNDRSLSCVLLITRWLRGPVALLLSSRLDAYRHPSPTIYNWSPSSFWSLILFSKESFTIIHNYQNPSPKIHSWSPPSYRSLTLPGPWVLLPDRKNLADQVMASVCNDKSMS